MNVFFWRKPLPVPAKSPVYGVNLGGWLVLEKWMTPSLFKGTRALDEYTLCSLADVAVKARIKRHRDTFITLKDFEWLRDQGVTAVRLPVSYGVFGDEPPYLKTIQYVDKAFDWAEKTGIKVLLDMHAAPGSQNGQDHSGKAGAVRWHKDEANIIKTLNVLTRLVRRYAGKPSLVGVELLNEPRWWVPRRKLVKYYDAAYRMIRKECGDTVWVVFGDNFSTRYWKSIRWGSKDPNVCIDTHQYQAYSRRDKRQDIAGHLLKTLRKVPRALRRFARHHNVIVGEWSLAGLNSPSMHGLNQIQREAATRAYGAAQIISYEQTEAWFYWSYKTEEGGVWSFRHVMEKGWLNLPIQMPAGRPKK